MESKPDNWTERSDCQQNIAIESNSSCHQTISQPNHTDLIGLINCGRLNQINNLFLLTEINKARAHVVGVPGFPPQLASPQGRSKIHIKRLQLPHATEPFLLLIPKDNVECRKSSYLLLRVYDLITVFN